MVFTDRYLRSQIDPVHLAAALGAPPRCTGMRRSRWWWAVPASLLFAGTALGTSGRDVAAQELRSPTIEALREELRTSSADTLDTTRFWIRMTDRGTPLVEALPVTDSLLVTFLWRGGPDTRNALVFGDLTGWLPPMNETQRLTGTDVWYLSVPAAADVRFRYRIAENDSRRIYWSDPDFAVRVRNFRPDPLNPDTVLLAPAQPGSWFQGPAFRSGRWTAARQPDGGRRDTLSLNGRSVAVYVPPTALGAVDVGAVIAMDGGAYDNLVFTPATVETLANEGTIPPSLVVLVPHADRNAELPPNEPFVRFVADTVMPALEARYPLSADPARSVVVGSSLGGLAALYLGFRLPDRFGTVVAQSGAYWWMPPGDDEGPWLSRLLARTDAPPLRVYLDAGALETQPVRNGASMLRLTQQLRDVLCARGDRVAYRTFPGGHFYEGWRETLPGALAWALGHRPLPAPGLSDACGTMVQDPPP